MEKPPKQPDAPQTPEEKIEQELLQTIDALKKIEPGINFLRGKAFIFELVPTGKSDLVNEECPARFRMVPTNDPMAHYEGIYEVLRVGVWEGIPEKYKPIIIAHELREHDRKSHDEALKYEMEIARRILSDEELKEYEEWRKKYDKKI